MLISSEIEDCRERLRGGSRSFYAASLLLPERICAPASALYAFCREADDLIDSAGREAGYAVALMRERINRIYLGSPQRRIADQAFAKVIEQFAIPRALPDALLEGFLWDADERRYETLDDLECYAARVAGSVGVMMTLVMGRRDAATLARAADLGVAMQLTNICRDVGEDALAGRLYLPVSWLRAAGIDPDDFLKRPVFSPALGDIIRAVLCRAEVLYRRSAPGIAALPIACRPAIHIARILYSEIGREIERRGFDSISSRAVVPGSHKVQAVARKLPRTLLMPRGAADLGALPSTQFLVDALADVTMHQPAMPAWYRVRDRAIWMIELFERLERERRAQMQRAG
ncbi:MAG: phytoene/squalene synthase family protein [Pseudorhodoplanes sp.]